MAEDLLAKAIDYAKSDPPQPRGPEILEQWADRLCQELGVITNYHQVSCKRVKFAYLRDLLVEDHRKDLRVDKMLTYMGFSAILDPDVVIALFNRKCLAFQLVFSDSVDIFMPGRNPDRVLLAILADNRSAFRTRFKRWIEQNSQSK